MRFYCCVIFTKHGSTGYHLHYNSCKRVIPSPTWANFFFHMKTKKHEQLVMLPGSRKVQSPPRWMPSCVRKRFKLQLNLQLLPAAHPYRRLHTFFSLVWFCFVFNSFIWRVYHASPCGSCCVFRMINKNWGVICHTSGMVFIQDVVKQWWWIYQTGISV